MKKLVSYTMTAFFAVIAVSFAAPDKEAIMAKEKEAWQAFKDKNADGFKKVASADVRAVYPDNIANLQDELDSMQKWDMKSFTISDYNTVSSGSDTIITTYKVVIDGTFNGQDMSGTYNAGSVWKMEKGGWKAIFHTNIKEATAASPTASP